MEKVWSYWCINVLAGGRFPHCQPAQSKLSMSALLAPSYIRTSSSNDQGGRYRTHQSSLPLGAMLHYHFSDRWSASSGLGLEWRYWSDKDYYNFGGQRHYFYIPLLFNYQVNKKRLSPYFSAGAQLYKWKYLNYGVPGNEVGLTIGMPVRVHYLAGAGVKYRFNEYLSLTTQPIFIYGSEDGKRTYQYSLQTQLVCRF